jgi:hypothetical protein
MLGLTIFIIILVIDFISHGCTIDGKDDYIGRGWKK